MEERERQAQAPAEQNEVHWRCDVCGKEGWILEPRYGCDTLAAVQAFHVHYQVRVGERRKRWAAIER